MGGALHSQVVGRTKRQSPHRPCLAGFFASFSSKLSLETFAFMFDCSAAKGVKQNLHHDVMSGNRIGAEAKLMEQVKVSLYKVASCGYYPRGDHDHPQFGRLDEILRDLQRWGANKRLAHTKTFDPADGGNHLPVYLVDATCDGAAWLLTLWNEAHNTEGTVTSINGQAAVGNANVSETEVEEGHIPGHATYFWFLPEQGLMASVRFQHPTTGVSGMNKYMRCFVQRFTSFAVLGEPGDDGKRAIVGYRPNQATAPAHYSARFKTDVFVKPGPLDKILENAASIRKLERKAKLDLAIRPEKDFFQRLLVGVHLSTHQTVQHEAKIKYEVEVNGLEEGEVREIISQWREEDNDDSDYGFVLRGDNNTHWLGREFVRETLELEVERDNAELVQPQSLLRELARHRATLLGRMT